MVGHLIIHSVFAVVSQLLSFQSVGLLISQSVIQFSQSLNRPFDRLSDQSVVKSMSPLPYQSVNQSVSQLISILNNQSFF